MKTLFQGLTILIGIGIIGIAVLVIVSKLGEAAMVLVSGILLLIVATGRKG